MWKILNKKKKYDDVSYLEGFQFISFLACGHLFVYFYHWVFITSFKEAFEVNDGPFYIPFVDFQPSLHAWEFVLMQESVNTLRSFYSIIISLFLNQFADYIHFGLCFSKNILLPKIASIFFF